MIKNTKWGKALGTPFQRPEHLPKSNGILIRFIAYLLLPILLYVFVPRQVAYLEDQLLLMGRITSSLAMIAGAMLFWRGISWGLWVYVAGGLLLFGTYWYFGHPNASILSLPLLASGLIKPYNKPIES